MIKIIIKTMIIHHLIISDNVEMKRGNHRNSYNSHMLQHKPQQDIVKTRPGTQVEVLKRCHENVRIRSQNSTVSSSLSRGSNPSRFPFYMPSNVNASKQIMKTKPRTQDEELKRCHEDVQKHNSTVSSSSSRGSNPSRIPFYMPSNLSKQILNFHNNSKISHRFPKDAFKVDREEKQRVRRNLFGREQSKSGIDRNVDKMIKEKRAKLMPRKKLMGHEPVKKFYKPLQVNTKYSTAVDAAKHVSNQKEEKFSQQVTKLPKSMETSPGGLRDAILH